MWNLPRPEIEPTSPALAGRFFTTQWATREALIIMFAEAEIILRQPKEKVLFEVWDFSTFITVILLLNLITKLHDLQVAAAAKSLQSCPTLCDPIDDSPPGSPVPGILQARTLEWVAISFSNARKWKVKVKSLSRVQLLATPWTAAYQAPPPMGFSRQEYWSGVPPASYFFFNPWNSSAMDTAFICVIFINT